MPNPSNPFEDPDGTYLVLVNDEGQHSLWPSFVDVPAGWTIALGESSPRQRAWTTSTPTGPTCGPRA